MDPLWWNNPSNAWQELNQNDFYLFGQKKVASFSNYLLPTHKKNHTYLTDSQDFRSQWIHLRRFVIDSMSKFHVESSSKFHRFWKANSLGNYVIDRFDVEISTFKIDEISMSFPRRFFYVVLMLNRRNFCIGCCHSIIS